MSWQDDDGTQSQVFGPVFVPGPQIPGNSWDARLPTNPPAAKAALLVAAMPFFFMSLGTELDVSAEEMGWQPVYADTVDRVEAHPAHAPYYFAELTETLPAPPTAPGDAAIWLPQYDDNLPHWDRRLGMFPMGRIEGSLGAPLDDGQAFYGPDFVLPLARGPHASLAPFHFWNPIDTPPIPVFDPVDFPWGVEYPDYINRKPFLPMGQAHGTLKRISTVPPAVYPDTIAAKPGLHASGQRAFFMDLEPIAAVFDETEVPQTSYPDQLPQWTRTSGHASQFPSVFYEGNPSDVDPQAEQMDWQPELPDFARRRAVHPSEMPSVFFVGEPSDVPATAEELGWLPVYPDAVDRLILHPAAMPSTFFVGEPSDVDVTAELAWRPTYPAAIDRLQPHASQMPSVFFEGDPRNFGFELGSWYPVYPDAVDRVEIHASQHPFFSGNLDPKVFPEVLGSWYPRYPDLLDPTPGLHASSQREFFFNSDPIPTPDIPIPEQNIRPVYPDTIDRRPSMHAAPYFFFVEEQRDLPPDAEEMGWQPTYPDQVARRTTHPSDMPSVFAVYDPDDFPVPALSWEPEYPSTVDRLTTHPSLMPSVFQALEPKTFPPPELSWEPELPTQVDRLEVHASSMPSVFLTLAPELFPVPDLSWEPEYPDQIARPAAIQAPFYFAPERDPAPAFDGADLSWSPSYPDAVARATVYPADAPAVFLNLAPENFTPPLGSWYGSYPDFATGRTTPHASQQTATFFDPEPIPAVVVPEFVPAVYPDTIPRIQPKGEVFIYEPAIFPTGVRVTQMPVEVVQIDDAIASRITQMVAEVTQVDDAISTRATQMVVEIVHTGDCPTFSPSEPPAPVPEPCPSPGVDPVNSHDCPPTQVE